MQSTDDDHPKSPNTLIRSVVSIQDMFSSQGKPCPISSPVSSHSKLSHSQLQQSPHLLERDNVEKEVQFPAQSLMLLTQATKTVDSQDIFRSIVMSLEQETSEEYGIDKSINKKYNIRSEAPIVIHKEFLWSKNEPTDKQKEWLRYLKKKYPVWVENITAANWLIGGEYSTYFTTIKNHFYPPKWQDRNIVAINKWFENHTSILPKSFGGKLLKSSGIDCMVHPRSLRWYINLRIPRKENIPYEWKDYLFIAKSTVGCKDYKYNEEKEPPHDQEYTVVDRKKYANSGLGLFFNRNFKQHECIGLYCGDMVHKNILLDTGYNIDWCHNRNYVIDAKGGLGYPTYFGWHFANAADEESANVIVDDDLRIFPTRDVVKGEEAWFFYGERRDCIDNLKSRHKKTTKKKVSKKRKSYCNYD